MSAKMIATLGLKVVFLTIILFLCYMVAANVSGVSALPADAEPPPVDAGAALPALVVASQCASLMTTPPRWAPSSRIDPCPACPPR